MKKGIIVSLIKNNKEIGNLYFSFNEFKTYTDFKKSKAFEYLIYLLKNFNEIWIHTFTKYKDFTGYFYIECLYKDNYQIVK